jgi:hypothetical protein
MTIGGRFPLEIHALNLSQIFPLEFRSQDKNGARRVMPKSNKKNMYNKQHIHHLAMLSVELLHMLYIA